MSTRLIAADFNATPSERPGTIRTCGWLVVFLLLFVGADTNGYTLTTMIAGSMLIAACAVAIYRKRGMAPNGLNLLAGLWLGVTGIALVTGYALGFGAHLPFTEDAFSPGPLGPAHLFFDQTAALAAFLLAGFPTMRRSMSRAVLASSGAIMVFAVIEFVIGWNKLHSLPRLQATFGNPNLFASFLAMVIPVTLSCALNARRRPGTIALSCLTFTGLWAALLFTQSRAAFLGAGLGVLLVLCVWWTARQDSTVARQRCASRLVWALAVGIALCGVAGFMLHRHSFGRNHSASDAQRLVAWHAASLLIKQHPVTGVGLGGFPAAMSTLNLLEPNGAAGTQNIQVHAVNLHAHDIALQYWAERGIGGLLIVVALIGALVWRVVRVLRTVPSVSSSTYGDFMFATGCLGALWGWLVQNSVDYTLWYAPVLILFWAILGAHFSWRLELDESQ